MNRRDIPRRDERPRRSGFTDILVLIFIFAVAILAQVSDAMDDERDAAEIAAMARTAAHVTEWPLIDKPAAK
jgi:hypothetical protein